MERFRGIIEVQFTAECGEQAEHVLREIIEKQPGTLKHILNGTIKVRTVNETVPGMENIGVQLLDVPIPAISEPVELLVRTYSHRIPLLAGMLASQYNGIEVDEERQKEDPYQPKLDWTQEKAVIIDVLTAAQPFVPAE